MRHFKKGISLIETLIYAAIFAVISILAANAILIMTRSLSASRALKNISASGQTAMERMIREIKSANGINVPLSVFENNPGRLGLIKTDPATGLETTIEFYADNGALIISEKTATSSLTSPKTRVSNLIFRQASSSLVSKAIKIELEIQNAESRFQKSEKFYGGAILRESYQ